MKNETFAPNTPSTNSNIVVVFNDDEVEICWVVRDTAKIWHAVLFLLKNKESVSVGTFKSRKAARDQIQSWHRASNSH